MEKGIQLTEKDVNKYRIEIDEIDLKEKDNILKSSLHKINSLLGDTKLDQFQIILVQEINALHNILRNNPNLEISIQQKILFALKYFLQGQDDIPDDIPGVGFIDDLAVVDWVIREIKDQVAELSLQITEKLLKKNLSDDKSQQELVKDYMKDLKLS